ncbi:MAG: ATP-binding protein [Phycisphaerales bacterium]|nr:ATP-binding protein [Phycisphaerales bacterium]
MNAEQIESLVSQAVEESKTLDFKQTLPGVSRDEKAELCADISAFANTSGGVIIYGISEHDGAASEIIGVDDSDLDGSILRIEQIANSLIEPTISGLKAQPLELSGGKKVLLVSIPRSWRSPHLVRSSGSNSFKLYVRGSRGKRQLEANEVRTMFKETLYLEPHLREWRDNRVQQFIDGNAPVLMQPGAKLMLHILPLTPSTSVNNIPGKTLLEHYQHFWPMGSGGGDRRLTFDGLLTSSASYHSDDRSVASSYCQLFRDGRVESVADIQGRSLAGPTPQIPSLWYEKNVLESAYKYMTALKMLGHDYPFMIALSLIGVKGMTMAIHASFMYDQRFIDRDNLLLPDILLEEAPEDFAHAFKPMFDQIWNSVGLEQSDNYDQEGKWRAQKLVGVPYVKSDQAVD